MLLGGSRTICMLFITCLRGLELYCLYTDPAQHMISYLYIGSTADDLYDLDMICPRCAILLIQTDAYLVPGTKCLFCKG